MSDYTKLMPHFYTGNSLNFRYGNVTCKQFRDNYRVSPIKWAGLKIVALPSALLGVVKMVVHVAGAIFHGIPKALFDKGRTLKCYSFCIARDLQETFGALASLFVLSYGQFHLQEAQAQKEFYTRALNSKEITSSKPNGESRDIGTPSTISTISSVPRELTYPDLIKLFPVHQSDNAKRFAELDPISVKNAVEAGEIRGHLRLLLSKEQLAALDLSKLDSSRFKNLFDSNDDENKGRFAHLNKEGVRAAVEKGDLSDFHYLLLSEDQLNELDLSNLNRYKLEKLFPLGAYQNEVRFAWLKKEGVKVVVESGNLSDHNCLLLSNEQLHALDPSRLSFNKYFPLGDIRNRVRFAFLKEEGFTAAIESGRLSDYHYLLFSDKQLEALDVSKLNTTNFDKLFPSERDNMARFALLKEEGVKAAIENDRLPDHHYRLLSDKQLAALDPSKLSLTKFDNLFPLGRDNDARFALLKKGGVRVAVENGYLSNRNALLLSQGQLQELDPRKLSTKAFEKLFPSADEYHKTRFAHLYKAGVMIAVGNGLIEGYLIDLVSIDVLRKLKFLTMPQAAINTLFPFWEVKWLREIYTSPRSFKRGNVMVTEPTCLYDDDTLEKISGEIKQRNDQLLAKLTVEQGKDLESRLYRVEG